MQRRQTAALAALTLAVVAGMILPAGAFVGSTGAPQSQTGQGSATVSAGVGPQLSTVVSTTTQEVRSEAEQAGFAQRFEQANATERAEILAERAENLSERATTIRADYDAATEVFRDDDIDATAYVQRLATLTARADSVASSVDRLANRADRIPDAERRALDLTDAEIAAISDPLEPLSSRTAGTILSQFTGESHGEIEIEVDGGVSLEVSSEDGERSRQFERPEDDNETYRINQSAALAVATSALSDVDGEWVLTSASTDDGTYEFEFDLHGAAEGEAEVAVDGSSGDVFELEESIESEEADDDEREVDDLAIRVVEGEPGAGENVTLLVTAAGEPVDGAAVELNEEAVGQTDANGTISLTFPQETATIKATDGEAEGELEFEFEDEEEREERSLGATADIENGTVSVSVFLDGQPLEGATITANDAVVGTTDANGTASFSLPAGDELDITVEYQDLEAELEYEFEDDEEEEDADDEAEDDADDENDEEEPADEQEEEDDEKEEEEEDTDDDEGEGTEDEEGDEDGSDDD